jgi:hypothetical protein
MVKEKTFLVVYQMETDGDIYIDRLTWTEILTKFKNFPDDSYAIIDGDVIKNFNKSLL